MLERKPTGVDENDTKEESDLTKEFVYTLCTRNIKVNMVSKKRFRIHDVIHVDAKQRYNEEMVWWLDHNSQETHKKNKSELQNDVVCDLSIALSRCKIDKVKEMCMREAILPEHRIVSTPDAYIKDDNHNYPIELKYFKRYIKRAWHKTAIIVQV